jgi:hypothetical protein
MKKRIYVLALAALTVLLGACAGSPRASQAEARQEREQMGAALNQEIEPDIQRENVTIDWSGANLGGKIPDWVRWVGAGDQDNQLATLPRVNGKKTIAVSSSGPDLDVLQAWGNLQAQGYAAGMIKAKVRNEAGNSLEGSKNTEGNKNAVVQFINAFAEAEISGLGREMDFWIKERSKSTNKESYTYYLVLGITEENFNFLIERALGKVQAETQEQKEMLDDIKDRMKELRFGVAKDENLGGAL